MKYFLILLIFFLTSSELFANETKTKAIKYTNGITLVKLLFKTKMMGKYEATRRKSKIQYITSIKVSSNDKLVFDMETSPYLSNNPYIDFKLNSNDIDITKLNLVYIDNNSKIKQSKIKYIIKKRSKYKQFNISKKDNLKISDINISDSMKKIYGEKINLINGDIKIKTPNLCENAGSIPINIRSGIKAKSVAIFAQSSRSIDNHNIQFICKWNSTPYSIIDYKTKIKMANSGNIYIIIEGKDGKFYISKKYLEISIAGLNVGG